LYIILCTIVLASKNNTGASKAKTKTVFYADKRSIGTKNRIKQHELNFDLYQKNGYFSMLLLP